MLFMLFFISLLFQWLGSFVKYFGCDDSIISSFYAIGEIVSTWSNKSREYTVEALVNLRKENLSIKVTLIGSSF